LWFGVRPEVTPELRALVEADLGKHRNGAAPQPAVAEKKKQTKRRKGAVP
jgi:D-serine deaminase-like pyridoxal phosphate-dependent protein